MIELLNDDCLNVMSRYSDNYFDIAIVDPPYAIGITESGWVKQNNNIDKSYKWDYEKPTDDYWKELFRVSKNQIVWGGNYFAHQLPITEAWICWNKKPFLKSLAHFELAWTSFAMKPKMYDYTYAGNAEGVNNIRVDYNKKSIHPAQKPPNIYTMILQDFATPEMKVLDTHLGSGSIAIACHHFGCDLVGIEINTKYFQDATQRYKDETAQLRML